jgi:small GTP-binding protein
MPYMFKICNAGDGGVGKTTFLKRYVTEKFVDESKETIGTGFFTKTLRWGKEKEKIDLTIWDLGGQERFRHIIKGFIMGASGALLFFDITNYTSFEHCDEWIKLLRSVDEEGSSPLPILLVGSKADLDIVRAVEDKEVQEFVKKNELIGYFETSSKTGNNIKETMEALVAYIYDTTKGIF